SLLLAQQCAGWVTCWHTVCRDSMISVVQSAVCFSVWSTHQSRSLVCTSPSRQLSWSCSTRVDPSSSQRHPWLISPRVRHVWQCSSWRRVKSSKALRALQVSPLFLVLQSLRSSVSTFACAGRSTLVSVPQLLVAL